ncbi:MAG: restriction endonuclease subunit S [Bacteroidota bacterium]|nr:restriction endonuclease subunit S [Bacteroidota bacterium]
MKDIKISDFTEVVTGGTPSTIVKEYWERGTIPWLNSGELNKKYIYKSKNFITESGLKSSSTRLMPSETVLIALTGATTGLSALTKIEACANQSVTGILPSKNHSSDYLLHYLRTQRERILDKAWGNAQPHISQQFVKDLVIPLPSLQHQIHIANFLSKAETLIEQRKQSIAVLDEFLKSIFLEMFGTPTSNKRKFPKGTIRDIVTEVKYGTSKPAEEKGKYPYLRMNNITSDGYWDFSKMKFINIHDDNEKKKCSVKRGDLLFNRTNSKELVGKTAVFNLDDEMIIAGYLIRLRFNEKANPYFVWGYLNSLHGKQTLLGMCNSIVGMANINAQELQDIKIIIPPLELQTQFANIVIKTETLKEQYKNSLRELENLYSSLSQRAFKGELTITSEETLSMAAEPETSYSKNPASAIPPTKKGFAKQVLGGKIISLFKDDKNFTDIKFQKLQYLAEHIIEEDLLWNYYRQAAGPYDNKFMHNVANKLKENKWFEKRNYKFYPLQKVNDIERYYQNYFSSNNEKLSNLFSLLKNASEKVCEAIATIYAVWNNHIIQKQTFDKEKIEKGFFEWSNRKDNMFTKEEFEKALDWMQKHYITPTGFGKEIKKSF